MKKYICLLLISILMFNVTACKTKEETLENVTQNTEDKNDLVDLTALSSTMVYSEVYNIMTNPDEYIGKTIKMKGVYAQYTNEDGSKFYPACVIADATACCSQGIEFILKDINYPKEGDEITVVGTFESYDEGGTLYYHLVNSELE